MAKKLKSAMPPPFPKRLYIGWQWTGEDWVLIPGRDGKGLVEADSKEIVGVYDHVGRASVVNETTVHERLTG